MPIRKVVQLTLLAGAIVLIGGGTAALAGGWATTTLDPMSVDPIAGQETPIAYTVRQHGVRPVTVDDTGIEVVSSDGRTTFFPGRPTGAEGRYVADVTFPAAGTWRWRAVQGWFGPQELGTVTIRTAAGGAVPVSDDVGEAGSGGTAWALLGAALASALAFAALGGVGWRRRRALQTES